MARQKQHSREAKPSRPRSSLLTKLLILLLLAGAAVELIHINERIGSTSAKNDGLSLQASQLEQENTALEEDIQEGPTVEKMKEIAREEMDYTTPGEYVFDIIGAG